MKFLVPLVPLVLNLLSSAWCSGFSSLGSPPLHHPLDPSRFLPPWSAPGSAGLLPRFSGGAPPGGCGGRLRQRRGAGPLRAVRGGLHASHGACVRVGWGGEGLAADAILME